MFVVVISYDKFTLGQISPWPYTNCLIHYLEFNYALNAVQTTHIYTYTHTHIRSPYAKQTPHRWVPWCIHLPAIIHTKHESTTHLSYYSHTLRAKRKTSPEHHLSWHATTKNHPAPELQLKIPSLNVMGTIFITIALTHDKKHRTFRCFCISKAYTNLKKKHTHKQIRVLRKFITTPISHSHSLITWWQIYGEHSRWVYTRQWPNELYAAWKLRRKNTKAQHDQTSANIWIPPKQFNSFVAATIVKHKFDTRLPDFPHTFPP